ncbi:MAG: NTP transferase domain-containing protein, partial [Pseudomonadota bacterium]
MNEPIACVVLAAGKGTRMKSQIHKVLHKVGGRSLLDHVLAGVEPLNPEQTIIVVGSGREQIEGAIKGRQGLKTALQEPQNGTGHAVQCAQAALDISAGVTLILYGDVPFVPTDTNRALVEKALESAGPVVLGFEAHDPGSYGRFV